MAIHCPKCGTPYDILQFEGGRDLTCGCGQKLHWALFETVEDFLRFFENEEEREAARVIQKDAELICRMILDETFPDVDIEIAKENLKEKVRKLFPDKMETYRMIYEARFKRLWDQFRSPSA